MGTLWAQLLLQFCTDLFWNFADVFCMEWRYACGLGTILWLFFLTLSALWTFWYEMLLVDRQWVPCGRNSSYSFAPIVLKLCRCFLHGMKMCRWMWYNPLVFLSLYISNFQLLICLSPQRCSRAIVRSSDSSSYPKIGTVSFYYIVIGPKDADEMANSVDPDLIWVYSCLSENLGSSDQ